MAHYKLDYYYYYI